MKNWFNRKHIVVCWARKRNFPTSRIFSTWAKWKRKWIFFESLIFRTNLLMQRNNQQPSTMKEAILTYAFNINVDKIMDFSFCQSILTGTVGLVTCRICVGAFFVSEFVLYSTNHRQHQTNYTLNVRNNESIE